MFTLREQLKYVNKTACGWHLSA